MYGVHFNILFIYKYIYEQVSMFISKPWGPCLYSSLTLALSLSLSCFPQTSYSSRTVVALDINLLIYCGKRARAMASERTRIRSTFCGARPPLRPSLVNGFSDAPSTCIPFPPGFRWIHLNISINADSSLVHLYRVFGFFKHTVQWIPP